MNNSTWKREDRSWFKGTCFKYGEEGHRDFECTNSRKNIRGSSRKTLSCEEVVEIPNEIENGENLMLRSVFWNEEVDSGSSNNMEFEELVKNL